MQPEGILISTRATADNFDEARYLEANPDVAQAIRAGKFRNGRHHFDNHGAREMRFLRNGQALAAAQRAKLERIAPLLRTDMPHVRRGIKYDFLSDELRALSGIADTAAVSSGSYDAHVLALIDACRDGLVLDCGAGQRPIYYSNVVNFEIVDYDSTDVLGVGEVLPFRDAVFDGIISIAVLEHVRDPFACAAEIARVLKPGGKLICCVPFLQPLHGYPHHYYNMSAQGLRALFERKLTIDRQLVIDSILPIWSLNWIVTSWADGLPARAREQFLSLRVRDLLGNPLDMLHHAWVQELSEEKNFELASATMMYAHKPSA